MRICKRCGTEITVPQQSETYYCDACRRAMRSANVVRQRNCKTCGIVFPGGPRAWYCPECRKIRLKASDAAFRRKGAERPIGSVDNCKRCGKEYMVTSGRQMYCPDCAEIAVKETIAPKKIEYNAKYRAEHPDQRAEIRKNTRLLDCPICGRSFFSTGNEKMCSPECKAEAHKRQYAEYAYRTGRQKTQRIPKIPIHKDEKGEDT